MRAIFGVLSLVIVLAVVGTIAKKQLFGSGVAGTGLAGRATAADRAAVIAADPGAMPGATTPARSNADTVPQQSKTLQQQARDRTAAALQQGADRNQRADP
jgi:hypothetical protein